MSDWLTYSPISGHGNSIITITANTLSEFEDRVATIIVSNSQYGVSDSVLITQEAAPTAITFENVTWVTDIPSSGGTATKDNCSYTIVSHYADGTTVDVTSFATVSGSLNVELSQQTIRHSAGTLTLTATYNGLTGTTSVTVYQEAAPKYIINITFDNLTWVTDIPASGGTATKDNCSYSVYVNYSNGEYVDITSAATVTGSLIVPSSTATTRQNVGNLTLTANYDGFSASSSVSAYQEAYEEPSLRNEYFTIVAESDGYIYWKTEDSSYAVTLKYSKDSGSTWDTITSTTGVGTSIYLQSGQTAMFKGTNTTLNPETIVINCFSGGNGFRYSIRGNIMSLFDENNFSRLTSFSKTYCCSQLFAGNSGLTDASLLLLPATALTKGCYYKMFDGCTSLTKAPELPAETLKEKCYSEMFSFCGSLNYIKCLATDISATDCTYYWLDHFYSRPPGTFVKNPNMTSWPRNNSGIPKDWTVIDAT